VYRKCRQPEDVEAARVYLKRLHIMAAATPDGRFELHTGQVLDRAEGVMRATRGERILTALIFLFAAIVVLASL
jgi:hypothetical protein